MTGTTSAAEWIGSGTFGVCAALLVAAAARLGASSADVGADRERAARLAERAAHETAPAPAAAPLDIPPAPACAPDFPEHVETLRLADVRAYRARHRKGQPVTWN